MASPMLVEEESFEWDMGDNFGFYEDLEDDDDDFGRGGGGSGGYGYESCSSSTAVAIIPSSPATPSSPPHNSNNDSIIHDIHPETLQTTPPILSSSLATKISEDGLPWSMQLEDMKWIRIFASSRDGCTFGTFMRNVRNVSHTIIVARTSSGKVVGGYATDVWSGRKVVAAPTTAATSTSSSHAFLFVVEQPAAATTAINGNVKTTPIAAAAVESPSHSQQKRQAHQNYSKRFIPGLEEIASSPTSPLEFDFDLERLNAKKISSMIPQEQEENNIIKVKSDEPQVHIFKPSPRKHPQHQQGGGHCYHSSSSFKQVCQLGNKFISLGDEYDHDDENHCLKLTIENSFSRGGITTTTTSSFKNKNGSGCISTTEEFDIVDFEVYYLSDD